MDAKIAAQDAAEDRARGQAVARHRAECEDPKSNRNRQLAAAWGPNEPVTAEPGTQGTRRRVLGEPTVIRAVPSPGDFRPAPGVSVARDPQPSAPLADVEVAA